MINFDEIKKHNLNGRKISDHPYRILTIGGSGSEKQIHCLI